MTPKQLVTLNFLANLVGKRIMPSILYSANPTQMIAWQFNLCVQTSIIVNAIIREQLIRWGLLDQYDVQSYEGVFCQPGGLSPKPYNHAWVYLKHAHNPDLSVLVDVARVEGNIPVQFDALNMPARHLECHITGSETYELKRTRLNHQQLLHENEYFTEGPGTEILAVVRAVLSKYNSIYRFTIPTEILHPKPALLTIPL